MALRKVGNIWVMYWNENGRRVQRSTGCTDEADARVIERAVMSRRRIARAAKRLGIDASEVPSVQGRRVRLDRMLDIAGQKRTLSREVRLHWAVFVRESGFRYADEVDLGRAESYLTKACARKSSKTFNNLRGYLHKVFRLCEAETGVESPFGRVVTREVRDAVHHRAYTDAEIEKILAVSSPYWKYMVTLSYHTGMSREMCDRFSSEHIVEIDGVKWARFVRSKTARFGRACLVPLRPEVFAVLPDVKPGMPFAKAFSESQHERHNGFPAVLEKAGIKDNADGKADFHSIRATFVTRCREKGIAEHAIRSMVGHVSSDTTDLYSHDLASPLELLK